LLIVIALIVLLIAIAVPAINFISGSRSIDGAQNQIAAFLGRARAEAMGVQEIAGVMFFIDKRTDRINMTLVHEVPRPDEPPPLTGVAAATDVVWLDLGTKVTTEPEFIPLPPGIGLQVIDDPGSASLGTLDDGYVGYNQLNLGNGGATPQDDTITPYGGVILFDGAGRLVSKKYAFKTYERDATNARVPTAMGSLLFTPSGVLNPKTSHATTINNVVPRVGTASNVRSQFGFTLYDREAFQSVNADSPTIDSDWQFNQSGSFTGQPEQSEEQWLDQNSTPVLVNRYNGTLIRGE